MDVVLSSSDCVGSHVVVKSKSELEFGWDQMDPGSELGFPVD